MEPQPCGVQVVEWFGLIASGFQFLSRLATVFAEEVGKLIMIVADDFATNLDIRNCPITQQTVLVRMPRLSFFIGLWKIITWY